MRKSTYVRTLLIGVIVLELLLLGISKPRPFTVGSSPSIKRGVAGSVLSSALYPPGVSLMLPEYYEPSPTAAESVGILPTPRVGRTSPATGANTSSPTPSPTPTPVASTVVARDLEREMLASLLAERVTEASVRYGQRPSLYATKSGKSIFAGASNIVYLYPAGGDASKALAVTGGRASSGYMFRQVESCQGYRPASDNEVAVVIDKLYLKLCREDGGMTEYLIF